IKILKNGPYLVSGSIPLSEKIIVSIDEENKYIDGQKLPQSEEYVLCRCGKSNTAPFCDGTHVKTDFDGTETAEKNTYEDRSELLEGPGIDLLDDNRCAFARFCHRKKGDVWQLVENSFNEENIQEAIRGACDCPTGRLVARDKQGNEIDPEYEPSIDIIQDYQMSVSGGIFVKGKIPIESSDGSTYEVRNRVVLCRCGKSKNKPFCDATHLLVDYVDK
ncbi:MAG TPA: iron-binding protein, partial [Clostridiaceae bacterium]|nr:iron-binding protein [Clostridiaceae bacterium]